MAQRTTVTTTDVAGHPRVRRAVRAAEETRPPRTARVNTGGVKLGGVRIGRPSR